MAEHGRVATAQGVRSPERTRPPGARELLLLATHPQLRSPRQHVSYTRLLPGVTRHASAAGVWSAVSQQSLTPAVGPGAPARALFWGEEGAGADAAGGGGGAGGEARRPVSLPSPLPPPPSLPY
jgi:hypothetical protein